MRVPTDAPPEPRVSLVLEQYRIAPEHYNRTVPFTVIGEQRDPRGSQLLAASAAASVRAMAASAALAVSVAALVGALAYLAWSQSVGLLALIAAAACVVGYLSVR